MFAATICSSVIVAGHLTGELAAARQDGLDDAPPPGLERPGAPPSRRRPGTRAAPRSVAQAARHRRQQVRVARVHGVDVLVLEGDAAGHGPVGGKRRERRGERLVPAERVQIHAPRVAQRPGSAGRPGILERPDGDLRRCSARGRAAKTAFQHRWRHVCFVRSLVAAGLFLAAASSAQAQTWTIDPAHSAAHFAVRHMMVSTVRGDLGKITGTVDVRPRQAGGRLDRGHHRRQRDRHPRTGARQAPQERRLLRRREVPDDHLQVEEDRARRGRRLQGDRRSDDARRDEGSGARRRAAAARDQGSARQPRAPARRPRRSSTGRTSASPGAGRSTAAAWWCPTRCR